MKKINSLDSIEIPQNYRNYLLEFIKNISEIPFINRVILFGSCAKKNVTKYSDIDLFITTNREITEDEEMLVSFYSIPEYDINTLPTDIIIQTENDFNNYADTFGMVQKQIVNEGIDLSGLLRQR